MTYSFIITLFEATYPFIITSFEDSDGSGRLSRNRSTGGPGPGQAAAAAAGSLDGTDRQRLD